MWDVESLTVFCFESEIRLHGAKNCSHIYGAFILVLTRIMVRCTERWKMYIHMYVSRSEFITIDEMIFF